MRYRFDVDVKSVSLERDAVDNPVAVAVSRGGKRTKTTPAATCTLVTDLDGYSGFGRHVYKDGSKYTGRYAEGVRNGRGTLRFASGGYYFGDWAQDRYHGKGRYVCADGMYEGEFKNGALCGRGTYRWRNGDVYEGEWKASVSHGVGVKRYATGEVEEGLWEKNEFLGCPELGEDYTDFTGYGRRAWPDGSTYVGEWSAGRRHGRGIFTFAMGDTYEGSWKDDKFDGHGKYTSKEGTYDGEHSNGVWLGKGEYTWADGRVYKGEFRDSAFDGKGTMVYPDGTKRKGRWDQDEFMGSETDEEDEDEADEKESTATAPEVEMETEATVPAATGAIVDIAFKDSGPTGLVLVERHNVGMKKSCLYLEEVLPRSAAYERTDLRCGTVLYSINGKSVVDSSFAEVMSKMQRRPLAVKFVDLGHFTGASTGGGGDNVRLQVHRDQTVVIGQMLSLVSTLKYNKKGRPELGFKDKMAKIDVIQLTGKKGKGRTKSQTIGTAKLNLASFAESLDASLPSTSEPTTFECTTKLRSLTVLASVEVTWLPPGSDGVDDVSDAESDVSDVSWYTNGSSALHNDTANLADFADMEGEGSLDIIELSEEESRMRQEQPLHQYTVHDVAIALREQGMGKYEPYFRERGIDGIALSTLSDVGWKDLFDNLLTVRIKPVDRAAIQARFSGQASTEQDDENLLDLSGQSDSSARRDSEAMTKNSATSSVVDGTPEEDAPAARRLTGELGVPPVTTGANVNRLRRGVKGMMAAKMLMRGPAPGVEPEPEPEVDPNARLLRFEYDSCTLHVGGIGGELEDEGVLRELFAPYGTFIQATVRQRPGINKSWALVSLLERDAIETVLEADVMADGNKLVVRKVSMEKAMGSTGMFPQLWRVGRTRAAEVIETMMAQAPATPLPSTSRSRRGSRASSATSRSSPSPPLDSATPGSGRWGEPPPSAAGSDRSLRRRRRSSNGSAMSGTATTSSRSNLITVAEAFDLYDEDGNGVANMKELRAIMKALGHRVGDEDLIKILGGDSDAEIDLATVTAALAERGHTDSDSPGTPGWRRTRRDSQTKGNKISNAGGGGGAGAGVSGLLKRRTRAMMMAKRLGGPATEVSEADGNVAGMRTTSRLDGSSLNSTAATREALAEAEEQLSAFAKILEGIGSENGGAPATASSNASMVSRLLSGDVSNNLATRSPAETLALLRSPAEDKATKQLLGRAVQDLCEVKVLLAESGIDFELLEQRQQVLEAQNYELEKDKASLYAAVVEAKLSLAQAELARQKLTVTVKRERAARDRDGQRIAKLELRLAAANAKAEAKNAASFVGDEGGGQISVAQSGAARVRRKAENGLQVIYDTDGDNDEVWEPPVNAKSAKSREIIREAIRNIDLFSHLQPEQLKKIIAAMAPVKHKGGDTIIDKGSLTSHFYVLESGDCTVETSDGDVLLLACGSSFGESSLLQPAVSSRSFYARKPCTLWRLERSIYLGIVVRTTAQRKAKFERLLAEVKLLSNVGPTERSLIADCLSDYHARAKSVIIQYGEKGDYFYIIVKGTASVQDRHGMELVTYGAGQYFGEAALINDAPRSATVVAVTDCELARIDKKTFVRLLGAIGDLRFREYEETGDGTVVVADASPSKKAAGIDISVPATIVSTEVRPQDHKLIAFETVGQLGHGAFGVVCLVRYRLNNKYYALKTMSKRLVIQKKQVVKIVRERENLALCSSASGNQRKAVVAVHAAFQDEHNLYLLTDFCHGGELFALLPIKLREARFVVGQVTLAIGLLHGLGIAHRDIKPENILLDREGHVKLCDFGLSKRVVDRTFTFCGTPDYMAPEIIQNVGHNRAVDYWALGCLLFETLVGEAPFHRRGGEGKLFERIIRARVDCPDVVPKVAQHLISRLLEKDLSKRFGNLKGGLEDIKSHRFFNGMDWKQLENRKFMAGGNLKPTLNGDGDMQRFAGMATGPVPTDETMSTMIPRAQQSLFQAW